MEFAALGSGSKGNAYIVKYQDTLLLIDCGLNSTQIHKRLEGLAIKPCDITAILVTHEHSDHTQGLKLFSQKNNIPVYANARTHEALKYKKLFLGQEHIFTNQEVFAIGAIKIFAFTVHHDAADPVGFVFYADNIRLGIITDCGHVSVDLCHYLQKLNGIIIEANYDEELLQEDTHRPWYIKQRIMSQHGHLSNLQMSELLHSIVQCSPLAHVMFAHMSSDCNTPQHIIATIKHYFQQQRTANDFTMSFAEQQQHSVWIKLSKVTISSI